VIAPGAARQRVLQPELQGRTDFLAFHLPVIEQEEIDAVLETLQSGWLTTGPRTKQFEQAFATFVGARYAIAVNSATAALHLSLDAVGVGPGDEVIVPTMTFAATAEVVTYLGATPVLVDCDPDTLNIDPAEIAEAMTPRTKAVMPVHFAGHACDMDAIRTACQPRGVKVIEDAAHALPAAYKGRTVGTIGDLTCFSFYATKTITTGEGGMITTDDPNYADRARIMSLHGISRDAWKRYTAEGSWSYEILYPGYKYNLTDLAAALGCAQLDKCRRFVDARRRIARLYDAAFSELPEIRRPVCLADVDHAWHLYVIRLELERLRISRAEFIEALREHRIGASVHFIPLHLHPYYRNHDGYRPEDFPNATAASERIVSLPIYPRMTDRDVRDVIDVVTNIIERNRR
jgi:dTDP-4-amino-4,6-dideoxygalactose transaminase